MDFNSLMSNFMNSNGGDPNEAIGGLLNKCRGFGFSGIWIFILFIILLCCCGGQGIFGGLPFSNCGGCGGNNQGNCNGCCCDPCCNCCDCCDCCDDSCCGCCCSHKKQKECRKAWRKYKKLMCECSCDNCNCCNNCCNNDCCDNCNNIAQGCGLPFGSCGGFGGIWIVALIVIFIFLRNGIGSTGCGDILNFGNCEK